MRATKIHEEPINVAVLHTSDKTESAGDVRRATLAGTLFGRTQPSRLWGRHRMIIATLEW